MYREKESLRCSTNTDVLTKKKKEDEEYISK